VAHDLLQIPLVLGDSVDLGSSSARNNTPHFLEEFQAIGNDLIDAVEVAWIYKWKKGKKT